MTYTALKYQRAKITWDSEGRPYSELFDDIYFSKECGLEETRYVFIDGNNLAQRIPMLKKNRHFTIAETGFGTGLNFLSTWHFWRKNTDLPLHFISVEKYPLSRSDLAKSLALWPTLKLQSEQLLANYPPQPSSGFQRISFDDGRITLTLFFGDATEGLSQLCGDRPNVADTQLQISAFGPTSATIDAWYLDGFAPSKNPTMWSEALFSKIGQLSAPSATFATFTAASQVKKTLIKYGFICEKVKGFGRKREMLIGNFTPGDNIDRELKNGQTSQKESAKENKRLARPRHFWHLMKRDETDIRSCIIIGGGMAGCHTARALAEKNIDVVLVEKNTSLAQGASGNKQGIVYAKLSPIQDPLSQFNLASLLFANRVYQNRNYYLNCGKNCGVLYLANDEKQKKSYQQFARRFEGEGFAHWLEANECKHVSGVESRVPGLFLPDTGWLDPQAMCRLLISHPKIQVMCGQDIRTLHYDGHRWLALDQNNQEVALAQSAVIANANNAISFKQCEHLPLKAIRGQVTHLDSQHHLNQLKSVICGDGYIAPTTGKLNTAGATFNLGDFSESISDADQHQNLARIYALSPDFAGLSISVDQLQGRVGFRCTTPDYMPIVGPLPNHAKMLETFSVLRKRAKSQLNAVGEYYPHLYCNIGHGSRGLAYSPLCAEIVASLVRGDFLPLTEDLYRFIHPARFLIRDLIRNKI